MMRLFYTLLLGLGASFAWRHPEDWWVDIVLSFPLVFRYRNRFDNVFIITSLCVLSFPLVFRYRNRFDNLFINASLCVHVRKVKKIHRGLDIKYVETVNVSG